MQGVLDRFFHLSGNGTTVLTEVRAGVATFLTLSYILVVNPQILAAAGMPREDVAIATALAAGVATLAMGLFANYPFALAPGMGLNAYFTYGVVQGLGVSWHVALAAVFVEGLLFLALSLGGVRRAILKAIPLPIKLATMTGIGLFLAIIGCQAAGIVVDHPATLVTIGDLGAPAPRLALVGLVLISALLARQVRGGILIGIAAVSVAAWATGLAALPERFAQHPRLPSETLWAFDFSSIFSLSLLPVILAFLFVDIFDTAGTLLGVGRLAGVLDERGELPRADRAFAADALGTTVGAALGTSTVTSYIESATGVEEGGRTGLTAVVIALLFFASLVFAPLFAAVPAIATAPALIVVGALMLHGVTAIEWTRIDDAVPAFLTIVAMPFTYSIANGISLGIVSWVAIRLLSGRFRDVHPGMGALAAALVLYRAFA